MEFYTERIYASVQNRTIILAQSTFEQFSNASTQIVATTALTQSNECVALLLNSDDGNWQKRLIIKYI